MHALITVHDHNYKSLSDLTWDANKLIYAKKYGYATHAKTDNFITTTPYAVMTGFEKLFYIYEIMTSHPEYEWIWCTGTDTMITNFSVPIDDRISNDYHWIIAVDVNGINADSLLIRNSPEGISFLKRILDISGHFLQYWDTEQKCIATLLGLPGTTAPEWQFIEKSMALKISDEYKNIVKLVPQRYMNSFNYGLYHYTDQRDRLGFDGNWQPGDWLIHWPSTSLELRVELANFYKQFIVE
jgi:hypothetical protein